jgi:hypothetical protein
MSSGNKASCRQLFRELNIPPVHSQYILSILLFVTKKKDQFISNSQVHTINTRQTSDLHIPIANLTIYKKGVYYQGIKIYNHLPKDIKDLSSNMNKFKLALKRYLLDNCFYSLKEYFDTQLFMMLNLTALLLRLLLTIEYNYIITFEFLTLKYIYVNTCISRFNDKFNFQLVFKFCIVIYILYCVDVHIL